MNLLHSSNFSQLGLYYQGQFGYWISLMVVPEQQDFWPKIKLKGNLYFASTINVSFLRNAVICFSKWAFNFKNYPNLSDFKEIVSNSLGAHFFKVISLYHFEAPFFLKWGSIFDKLYPKICWLFVKILLFRTHHRRFSITKLTLI